MVPEFYGGQITYKFDIYSLGMIIIEIVTGEKGYPNIDKVRQGRYYSIIFPFSHSSAKHKLAAWYQGNHKISKYTGIVMCYIMHLHGTIYL